MQLRPNSFKEFIGQKKLKSTLKVIIESAKKRKKQMDHVLLHGKAGIGKTTLAVLISKELESDIRFAQGPLLEKKADILSLFASLKKGDVIFIDEIHGINKNVEELLYSALEDCVIDIPLGPEGDSKIVRMKLPSFTMIGATTKIGVLTDPLRDRFGIKSKLEDYSLKDVQKIIKLSAKRMKIEIDDQGASLIAEYSRLTPRIANNLLKRVFDFAIVSDKKAIELGLIHKTFKSLGLYKNGLTESHLSYLKLFENTFLEKAASIDIISSILGEEKRSIENNIEPYLVQLGLIEKTSRGRMLTNKGVEYLSTYNLK